MEAHTHKLTTYQHLLPYNMDMCTGCAYEHMYFNVNKADMAISFIERNLLVIVCSISSTSFCKTEHHQKLSCPLPSDKTKS